MKAYYSDDYCTIYNADCLDVLHDIDKCDLLLTDPPYGIGRDGQKRTTSSHGGRKASAFWRWCRVRSSEGHKVFISEYNAPTGFSCVWEKEIKSSLSANGKCGGSKSSTERLFAI